MENDTPTLGHLVATAPTCLIDLNKALLEGLGHYIGSVASLEWSQIHEDSDAQVKSWAKNLQESTSDLSSAIRLAIEVLSQLDQVITDHTEDKLKHLEMTDENPTGSV